MDFGLVQLSRCGLQYARNIAKYALGAKQRPRSKQVYVSSYYVTALQTSLFFARSSKQQWNSVLCAIRAQKIGEGSVM
jgi:hypothetical protein